MSRIIKNLSKRWKPKHDEQDVEKVDQDFLQVPGRQLLRSQHLMYVHKVDSASLQPSSEGGPHKHNPQNTAEDQQWLKWIEVRMGGMAKEAHVDLVMFKKILEIEHAFYGERLFAIFDIHRVGYVTVGELLSQLSMLTRSCACQKLKLIFDMYDVDGNGAIDTQEFSAVLSSAIDDNALAIGPQQIDYMTRMLFEAVDSNQDGVVSFDELKTMLEKSPEWIGTLQISASRFLRPPEAKGPSMTRKKRQSKLCPPYFLTPNYIKHNPTEFAWSVIYAISLIAFYLYGSLWAVYENHVISTENCLPYYAVAHGFGMNLNWNCMLLVVFMLRRTLTLLRNTRLGPYLPVDVAIYAHKVIGYVVGVCTLGHFVMHMLHFHCLEEERVGNLTYTDFLFSTKNDIGWISGAHITSITGWPIIIAYVIIFFCSLAVVRRSGLFEIFFFTHLLYIPFMILLILHSDKFWKFIIVPGTIYILEKISMTRCVRQLIGGEFYIKDVVLWQSGVTQLTMNHPPCFNFNPGDYIFINIPNIAWFEWHPFTLSSCPENQDEVTLHIRCMGQWTRRLHQYFKNHERNCGGVKTDGQAVPMRLFAASHQQPSVMYKKRASVRGQPVRSLHVPIYVDGPYGTPSGQIFMAEHAVLICAGIGVTPFASILQSIMYRHRADKAVCPECAHEWSPHRAMGQSAHLKKVNFIWVVPNQRSIEWFVELLEQLDAEQSLENDLDKLIDIQIYVTSATRMADLYAFALTTALDVFYEKHNRDLITGIRSRAIPGRPNWQNIFENINRNKRGRVSVFYCGPPVLAGVVRRHCGEFDFEFSKESF
ncbi:NADPH oxidase 5 [Hypsibius exemplaris]|uniref:NADPH oxidase 5 n=1 Tax=Hypsibius exemplaris TaxID=2072580 RepID=A0A1W0WE83_HYPEX|nr:NADPH oxidase 5 [Hypsibius exemplaris]